MSRSEPTNNSAAVSLISFVSKRQQKNLKCCETETNRISEAALYISEMHVSRIKQEGN